MKRMVAAVLWLSLAVPAGAQCLGDFNGDLQVQINELILAVNNALSGCGTPACPVDFDDDNTPDGSPTCVYTGRWNPECGAADLEAQFVSDGNIIIIAFTGFTEGLFFAAQMISPTTAAVIGWYTQPDLSDLELAPGTLRLDDGGARFVLEPFFAPFELEGCDFVRYEAPITRATAAVPAVRQAAASRSADALSRLHAARSGSAPETAIERGGAAGK
jgi:hypothetical protein